VDYKKQTTRYEHRVTPVPSLVEGSDELERSASSQPTDNPYANGAEHDTGAGV
jgi:hypothetical protein